MEAPWDDAFQQHRELLSRQFVPVRKTAREGALLQSFVPDDESVALPVEDFDQVSAPIQE